MKYEHVHPQFPRLICCTFTAAMGQRHASRSCSSKATSRPAWRYCKQQGNYGNSLKLHIWPKSLLKAARLRSKILHDSPTVRFMPRKKKRCSKLSLKQTFLHLSTLQSGRHLFNGNTPLPRSLMPRRKLHTLVSRGKTHYLSDCQGTQHCPGPRKEAEGMDMSHGNYVTNPEETLLMWAGGFF